MVGLSSEMVSRAAQALRGMGLLNDDTPEADVPAQAERLGLLGKVANQNGVGATYEPEPEDWAKLENMRVNGPPPRSSHVGATYEPEPGVWDRFQNAGQTVADYASQGGPFRPDGPLGGVAQNVAEGLVNFPRAMGFSGTNAQQDINNFASMAPTPMAGMGGPRMSGAGVGGRAAAAPISMRAAPPPGMVHEQSRLDDDGNQWMTDPSTGAEINLTEMENSANRYLQQGGDLPPNTDDVPGRVAEHFRRTSKGIQEMPKIYSDMGMQLDMAEHIKDIERGYTQNAAAYLPEGAEALVDGNRIKFIDPNPGQAFYEQAAQREAGYAPVTKSSNTWTPINREAPAGVSRKQILDKMQGQGIPKEQAERMAGTQRSVDWYNGKGDLVPHAADSKGISLNGIRDFTKMNRGEIVNGLMSQGVKQEDAIAIVRKNLDNPSLHDYKKMQSAIEAFNNLPKLSEAADMIITRGGK